MAEARAVAGLDAPDYLRLDRQLCAVRSETEPKPGTGLRRGRTIGLETDSPAGDVDGVVDALPISLPHDQDG